MRYVVTAPFHISPVDQVSASTGDDVAAANVHSDAHHPVRGHTTAGRGHHCGDVTSTALRVKVVPSTALPIQLSFRIVGVGCSAGGGRDQIRTHVGFYFICIIIEVLQLLHSSISVYGLSAFYILDLRWINMLYLLHLQGRKQEIKEGNIKIRLP